MDIKISYKELKENHTDLIRVLTEKIRSSKSKDNNKSESEFEWSYSYGITVKGGSFEDMISATHMPKNIHKMIAEKLNSVFGISLSVTAGRTKRYVALDDKNKPKLFIQKFSEIYMTSVEDIQKEQDRLSKLTPEEKNREIQENINELSDMGGFIGLNISKDEVQPIVPTEIEYEIDDILDKIGRVGMSGLTAGEKKFLEDNSK